MACIQYLFIAMLLTSALVVSPVLANTGSLSHDGERDSKLPCLHVRGEPICPPPPPSGDSYNP